MTVTELTPTQAKALRQPCAVYNGHMTRDEMALRHAHIEGYFPAVAFHTPEHWLIPLSPAYVQLEPVREPVA